MLLPHKVTSLECYYFITQVRNGSYANVLSALHTQPFWVLISCYHFEYRKCSGSVVECLTRDLGAAGLSLTGITVLCP